MLSCHFLLSISVPFNFAFFLVMVSSFCLLLPLVLFTVGLSYSLLSALIYLFICLFTFLFEMKKANKYLGCVRLVKGYMDVEIMHSFTKVYN